MVVLANRCVKKHFTSVRSAIVVVALLGASCNAILGLDDVRPADGDGRQGGNGGSAGGISDNAGGAGSAGTDGRSCGRELSTNGAFDLGMTSWNEGPEGAQLVRKFDDPEVAADGVTPQSGLYVLRLGAPSVNKYVYHFVEQYAEIPSDALEVTISGYVQVRTEEPMDRVSDESWVRLFDEYEPSSPFFQSVPRWSNLTHANNWTLFSFPVDVAAIAGKEMVFGIVADLDTSIPTYFYFDTVSVTVSRCLP